jgi:hypothetical protein
MALKTRCAHDDGAGEAAGVRGDAPGAEIEMDNGGTEATLALGVAALPVPRPKLHPAHAAVIARAIATGRRARVGVLSVTTAMLRTADHGCRRTHDQSSASH